MGFEQKMWETKDKPVSRSPSGLVVLLVSWVTCTFLGKAQNVTPGKPCSGVSLISEGEQADGGGRGGQLRWKSGSLSWSFISQVYWSIQAQVVQVALANNPSSQCLERGEKKKKAVNASLAAGSRLKTQDNEKFSKLHLGCRGTF